MASVTAVVLDVEQGSPKWHAARKLRYGASEVPKLAGLCPYGGPADVWRSKRGIPSPRRSGDLHLRIGHALESLARDLWREETGQGAEQGPVIAQADGWLLASLDSWSTGLLEPIDAKVRTRGAPDYALWSASTIPGDVELQIVQQAILVEQLTGKHLEAAHVAALVADSFGFKFMAARLPLTSERRELHAELASQIPAWHAAYVVGDAIPEDCTWRDVAALVDVDTVTYRPATEAELSALAGWREIDPQLTEANRRVTELEKERDRLKSELARSLGGDVAIPGLQWKPYRGKPVLQLTKQKE